MVSADDVHRLFLQAILSRGFLSATLAQTLWVKSIAAVKAVDQDLVIPYSDTREAWDAFVAKLNRSLDTLDLEFRHLHDETSGKELYALVNRKDDAIAQVATDYNPAEIAFLKAIIDLIMLAPNESFSVSSLAALRELNAIKPKTNMSKAQAEIALGSFAAKGWLLKSKRGRYSLSARSLLELLPYLKSTYPDEILECTICMEILTRGMACHTTNCKTRMHYHCFTAFRRRQNACPSCRAPWPATVNEPPLIPVGEGASKGDDDIKRTRRRKGSEPSDDDEDDEMVDEEESAGTQSQPAGQRSQRTRRGKGNTTQNMDVDGEDEEEVVKPGRKTIATRRSSRR